MPLKVLYTADAFNSTPTANMHLALALTEQGCAVAVHTPEEKLQFLGTYSFLEPLKDNETVFFDFVRNQEELKHKYKTTTIILNCPKNTLIPSAIYNDLHLEGYLRHLYMPETDEIIKAIEVISGETQLIFAAKKHLFYPVRSKYYDAKIEPLAANYIRKSIKHHPNKVNAFITNGQLYLVHTQNSNLQFYNNFTCETVDEVAYFILNYYQALGTNAQQAPLLLHGHVHPQLVEILNTFAGKFETAPALNKNIDVPASFEFDYLIDFTH